MARMGQSMGAPPPASRLRQAFRPWPCRLTVGQPGVRAPALAAANANSQLV
jgi:hypothetical protein